MFISIPKEFFVPVVFSEDFRYNSENDSMEYDTEEKKVIFNRDKLQDLDFINETRQEEDFIDYYKDNIADKDIEEQTIKYIISFVRFIDELKAANCLGKTKIESIQLINYYAKNFRELYEDYNKLISDVRMPISTADSEGLIDKYIGKLADIYNENLKELNCKNLDYDMVEKTIDNLLDDAREILKEKIRNINCRIVNKEDTCENPKDVENAFNKGENVYKAIDEEYLNEIKK